MKRTKTEIFISSESDEEINIKREPYSSPELKPGRLPCDEGKDDIDGKFSFSASAKRQKIENQTAKIIQEEVYKLKYIKNFYILANVKLEFYEVIYLTTTAIYVGIKHNRPFLFP